MEGRKKFPKNTDCSDVKPCGRSRGPSLTVAHPRRLFRKALLAALTAAALILIALAAAFLWKPAGVGPDGAHPSFVQALASSPVPLAAAVLAANGRARLTLTETNLCDILRALLDRNDHSIPETLSAQVRRSVPDFVESVCLCRMSPSEISLTFRCRRFITLYVTVSGQPVLLPDGTVRFDIHSITVGALPMPGALRHALIGADRVPIASQENAPVVATALAVSQGAFNIDLQLTERGSKWLKKFFNL